MEYSLTPVGRSLMPIIGDMINWALSSFSAITARTKKPLR
ncbi:winged helix-turn-helix transcriptional regulator [Muribaculum intestinale]